MMRSRISFVFVVVSMFVAPGLIGCEGKKPCAEIERWDDCDKAVHCSPAHLIVHNDHVGPVWECQPK
jgi:hypothetical protein